jgi:hypothetical protein
VILIRRRSGARIRREAAIELLAGALTRLEECGTAIGELTLELEPAESQLLQSRLTRLQTNASGMLRELAGDTGH